MTPNPEAVDEVEALEKRAHRYITTPEGDGSVPMALFKDAVALLRRLSQPAPTSEPCKWPRGKCPHVPDCYAAPPPAGSRPEDAGLVERLRSPEVIDQAARTMARMVYGFGHAERIQEYTSPELQREHVKIAGYVIHAAIVAASRIEALTGKEGSRG